MNLILRFQLSLMMFAQSFVWGAWYVTAPNYLGTIGFTPADFGWTYSVGPIAGVISPIFVGILADRYVSAEKVLGGINFFGAAAMLLATVLMQDSAPSPTLINFVFFLYMLAFYPTFALLATLTMRHIEDPQKHFPGIRVWGTIGWIVAGFVLTWTGWEKSIDMFYLAVISGLMMGVYCFFLPNTRPMAEGRMDWRQMVGAQAWVLLKNRSFLIFMVCSWLICIPLAFYQQIVSRVVEMADMPIGQTMAYGQISEIVFMVVMPFFFIRLGVKWMLAAGMAAWLLRYVLFALGAPMEISWMILIGIMLHGVCQDFFVVTGQIYTDQLAPKAIRAQAQGMLVILTLGLGMAIGAQLAGYVETRFTPPQSTEYAQMVQDKGRQIVQLEAERNNASADRRDALDTQIAVLQAERKDAREAELKNKNWTFIFGIPAALSALALLLFVVLFRDDRLPLRRKSNVMRKTGVAADGSSAAA
ncbi:MFS transporter [Croceicoccus mobilis]|uniref:MFS transporter n=1 Tax=Croceicoccus mobilis TaxID=1703339 RepID=A0A916Z823_9SPHN|nr:MFS transporter [Croceicoccus mobilis]GGD79358.1 MFS transporter [Croceicoccus mobilis]